MHVSWEEGEGLGGGGVLSLGGGEAAGGPDGIWALVICVPVLRACEPRGFVTE